MDFTHYTTETRKGQHLNFEERMTIELRLKDGWNINQIRCEYSHGIVRITARPCIEIGQGVGLLGQLVRVAGHEVPSGIVVLQGCEQLGFTNREKSKWQSKETCGRSIHFLPHVSLLSDSDVCQGDLVAGQSCVHSSGFVVQEKRMLNGNAEGFRGDGDLAALAEKPDRAFKPLLMQFLPCFPPGEVCCLFHGEAVFGISGVAGAFAAELDEGVFLVALAADLPVIGAKQDNVRAVPYQIGRGKADRVEIQNQRVGHGNARRGGAPGLVDLNIRQIGFEAVGVEDLADDLADGALLHLLTGPGHGNVPDMAILAGQSDVGCLGIVRQRHNDLHRALRADHADRKMILISSGKDLPGTVRGFLIRHRGLDIAGIGADEIAVEPELAVFEILIGLDRAGIAMDMPVVGIEQDQRGRRKAGAVCACRFAGKADAYHIPCDTDAGGNGIPVCPAFQLRFGLRCGIPLIPGMVFIHHLNHDLGEFRIKLLPRFLDEFLAHDLVGERGTGVLAGDHGVVGIGHRNDAGDLGNVIAPEPFRIARSVIVLPAVAGAGAQVGVFRNARQDLAAQDGLFPAQLHFLLGELAGFAEHGIRNADQSHIMQQRRIVDLAAFLLGLAGSPGNASGIVCHPDGMSLGMLIALFDGGYECIDRLVEEAVHALLFLLEIADLELMRLFGGIVDVEVGEDVQADGDKHHGHCDDGQSVGEKLYDADDDRQEDVQHQRNVDQPAEGFPVLPDHAVQNERADHRHDVADREARPAVVDILLVEIVIKSGEMRHSDERHADHGTDIDDFQPQRPAGQPAFMQQQIRQVETEGQDDRGGQEKHHEIGKTDHEESELRVISLVNIGCPVKCQQEGGKHLHYNEDPFAAPGEEPRDEQQTCHGHADRAEGEHEIELVLPDEFKHSRRHLLVLLGFVLPQAGQRFPECGIVREQPFGIGSDKSHILTAAGLFKLRSQRGQGRSADDAGGNTQGMHLDGVQPDIAAVPRLADGRDIAVDGVAEEPEREQVILDTARILDALRDIQAADLPEPLHVAGQVTLGIGACALGNFHHGIRNMPHDRAFEILAVNGLGQEAVEAPCQVEVLALGRIGGNGVDRKLGVEFPDLRNGGKAVHARHNDVKEYHIEMGIADLVDRILAASGGGDEGAGRLEKALHEAQIGRIVVHNENVGIRRDELRDVRACHRALGLLAEHADRGIVHDALGECQDEFAALPVDALASELAAHQLGKAPGNIQTQTRSLNAAVELLVKAFIGGEELVEILLPDAHAGVLDGEAQSRGVTVACFHGNAQDHAADAGVLHGIGQEIQDDLLDLAVIAVESARENFLDSDIEGQSLFLAAHADHGDHGAQHVADVVFLLHQVHSARFDLGDVEQVIDETEQGFRSAADVEGVIHHREEIALRNPGGILAHDHFIRAHDGIDRGADLVGHIGQEAGFGGVGAFCLLLGMADLVILPGNDRGTHGSPDHIACHGCEQQHQQDPHNQQLTEAGGLGDLVGIVLQHLFRILFQDLDVQGVIAVGKVGVFEGGQIASLHGDAFVGAALEPDAHGRIEHGVIEHRSGDLDTPAGGGNVVGTAVIRQDRHIVAGQ